jgi:mRNA-degrading endonuclease toxin of MazEF toxin-antitoxin module
MTYERGDVVEAGDPFNEGKPTRPFLLVSDETHPFAGEQYIAVTLTTKTWYEETVSLDSDDFLDGDVPADSYVVPWGVVSPAHDDIRDWFGRVSPTVVDEVVDQLVTYLRTDDE